MKKIFMIATLALIALSWGCNKEDKLWDAIGDLTNRVQALEKQVDQLNNNVKTLGELHKAGSTVTSVAKDAATGTWTVTLSNGEQLTLKQGSDASATVPVMAINAAGNWTASYDNGVTFTEIMRGTPAAPVKAETSNPLFRVDSDGFWQVSYDGTTYTNVLTEAGLKVNAFKTGTPTDSFFQGVVVADNMLKITMLNGEVIEVPVVKDFFCIIDKTGVASEPVMFSAGAQKVYDVKLKGIDNTIVSAPEGWKAKLSAADADGNASLTITAPGEAASPSSSRATADNTKDVSILATSSKYATIAKIAVATDGVVVVAPTITSVIADANATGPYTLTFNVVMSADALGYRYIAQKSSVAAPTLAKIISEGTTQADPTKAIVIDKLDPLTEYAVYVVAYKGATTPIYSEAFTKAVASTTTDIIDYWESGIMIEGVRYDKNSPGAELLSVPANAAADVAVVAGNTTQAKVIFLEPSLSPTYNYSLPNAAITVAHDLIIIGRHSNQKSKMTLAANTFFSLAGTAGAKTRMVIKNMTVVQGARTNYFFNNGGAKATFDLLLIEDCVFPDLSKSLYYRAVNTMGFEKLILRNNSIKMTAAVAQFFNFDASTVAITYKLFEFSNNLVYGAAHYAGQIINFSAAVQGASSGTWDTEVKITNNTIVNYSFSNPMFRGYRFGTLNISKNIFLPGAAQSAASYLYLTLPSDPNMPVGSGTASAAPVYTFSQNIVYGGGTQAWDHYHSTSEIKMAQDDINRITKATQTPMATADVASGSFIRTAATKAADIGSSLEK